MAYSLFVHIHALGPGTGLPVQRATSITNRSGDTTPLYHPSSARSQTIVASGPISVPGGAHHLGPPAAPPNWPAPSQPPAPGSLSAALRLPPNLAACTRRSQIGACSRATPARSGLAAIPDQYPRG